MTTEKALPTRVDSLDLMQLGEVFVRSGYFKDVRDHAAAVVKILAGRELGVGPMAAMTGIHVIEGKPSLGAHLIALGIKRSKRYDYRVKEKSATRCEIEFFERQADGKLESIGLEAFTIEEAKAAGLSQRGPWKAHPKAMLFARAIGQGYRTHCPDAFEMTVYAEGEIDGEAPAVPAPKDAIDVEYRVAEGKAPKDPSPASPPKTSSASAGPTSSPSAPASSPSAAPGPSPSRPAPAAAPSIAAPAAAAPAAAPASAAASTGAEALRARIWAARQKAPSKWHAEIDGNVKGAGDDTAALEGIVSRVEAGLAKLAALRPEGKGPRPGPAQPRGGQA